MFSRTNIEDKLEEYRENRIDSQDIMNEVEKVFLENENARTAISAKLIKKPSEVENNFNFNLLQSEHIFHIDDIQGLCINYRLRFLDSHYFKGDFPEEAISEIRNLEKTHDTVLDNFKIIAPAKLLKLENADDPLLFAPMGNGYYYLIHKWGKDLHPFRKLLMWPYKSLDNLVFMVALLSIFLTAITPIYLLTPNPGIGEYLFLAFFIFIGMGGMVILYGFSKGKNFNGAIWKSKYYNA
ncbi:hypothetical protein [Aequorivita marina]|uniref:hypothetical protein n=1 Tax=Aequorivita marina TaxID=3073654 RepID=UPI002874DEFE|nr:hypothetical protein [Aequorivita sp. S2608]MDS1299354.1 hypothetical protein [Aequorivita sp. S2608]